MVYFHRDRCKIKAQALAIGSFNFHADDRLGFSIPHHDRKEGAFENRKEQILLSEDHFFSTPIHFYGQALPCCPGLPVRRAHTKTSSPEEDRSLLVTFRLPRTWDHSETFKQPADLVSKVQADLSEIFEA